MGVPWGVGTLIGLFAKHWREPVAVHACADNGGGGRGARGRRRWADDGSELEVASTAGESMHGLLG